MIKATRVDGVFSMDPEKYPGAVRYDRLSYDEVIKRKLGVMDATAIVLCRDHTMPVRVMDMARGGALLRAARGYPEGSLIGPASDMETSHA